jgi:hypothetical protein
MLILALLLALNVALLRLVQQNERKRIVSALLIIFVVNIVFAILHQMDQFIAGKSEYGSDALNYWNDVLRIVDGRADETGKYAESFKWYSAAIQVTSPFTSIFLTRIGNILLLTATLTIIYSTLRTVNVSARWATYSLLLIGLNGIVIWATIRHQKEPLMWLMTTGLLWAIYFGLYKITRNVLLQWLMLVVSAAIFAVVIETIRVWGYFLALIVPPMSWLLGPGLPRRWIIRVGITAALLAIPIVVAADLSRIYIGIASGREIDSFWDLASQMLTPGFAIDVTRLVVGPGPVMAMFGNERFVITTNLGNVLIFAGSLMWWILLPQLVMLSFSRKSLPMLRAMAPYIFSAIVMILVLAFIFGGTTETRNRATIYIFLIPVFAYIRSNLVHIQANDNRHLHRNIVWVTSAFITMAAIFSFIELNGGF